MPEAIVTNPLTAAYAGASDFTTFKDRDGNDIQYGQDVRYFRANEAITKWQVVALVAATTSVPVSVEPVDVSDAFAGLVMLGVAQETVAAGALVRVVVEGITLAQVDTGDPVFGDVAIKGASDGTCTTAGTLGGTWDGSDVTGTALGIFLDVEDAANLAPLYVHKF